MKKFRMKNASFIPIWMKVYLTNCSTTRDATKQTVQSPHLLQMCCHSRDGQWSRQNFDALHGRRDLGTAPHLCPRVGDLCDPLHHLAHIWFLTSLVPHVRLAPILQNRADCTEHILQNRADCTVHIVQVRKETSIWAILPAPLESCVLTKQERERVSLFMVCTPLSSSHKSDDGEY